MRQEDIVARTTRANARASDGIGVSSAGFDILVRTGEPPPFGKFSERSKVTDGIGAVSATEARMWLSTEKADAK